MEEVTTTIRSGFIKHFQEMLGKVHQWAEPLSEEQFWTNPYGYGNSYGHLVLHLTGNLNYYIGAQIAQTGYIRERDREFTDPQPPTKAEALQRLDDAVRMVIRTLEEQTTEDWSKPYSAVGAADIGNRFNIVLRCASHLFHHLGQMIYLQREWAQRK